MFAYRNLFFFWSGSLPSRIARELGKVSDNIARSIIYIPFFVPRIAADMLVSPI